MSWLATIMAECASTETSAVYTMDLLFKDIMSTKKYVTGFWKINHFVTFHTLNIYS